MTIPSHRLLMAAVDLLGAIEHQEGRAACRQASDLLDQMFARPNELVQLNSCAERSTRNVMKGHLQLLLRRDARLVNA
jgi:hypothetical protein